MRRLPEPGDALITGVALESACDYFFGRPLDANPYSRHEEAANCWRSWRHGWLDAAFCEWMHGERERARWWRRAA